MGLPIIDQAAAAKNAHSCLDWLDVCKAECCRMFQITIALPSKPRKGSLLAVSYPLLNDDLRFYYELHGVRTTKDALYIRLNNFTYEHGKLTVYRKCDYLTPENTCQGHPDKKPEVCKILTHKNRSGVDYVITPNCLFNYKDPSEDL